MTKHEREIVEIIKRMSVDMQKMISDVRRISTSTGCDKKKQIKPSLNERLER